MNFADMFALPTADEASADYDNFTVKDHNGEIVVFFPTEYLKEVETSFGTKDAVQTRVLIVTGPAAGKTYDDARIFQGALIGMLKRRIGKPVAGRIGQGAKKKGFSAPWVLEPLTSPTDQAAVQTAVSAMESANDNGSKIPF